jgi:hypothetical protein
MASPAAGRLFGGSPISVMSRLGLLSVVVGIGISTLGVDPMDVVKSLEAPARQAYALGFDAARLVWQYFLVGAGVVIPLWLVLRLIRPARR